MKLDDLKADRRWVAYTTDKTPINPHTGKLASTTKPATWGTYAEAQKRVEADKLGGNAKWNGAPHHRHCHDTTQCQSQAQRHRSRNL